MPIPEGVGTWGVILAIVLSYALGVFTNLTTPVVRYVVGKTARASVNWLATWSRSSLEKRITKLENKLAEPEKAPAIDEVQNQMFWAIRGVKMETINVGQGIILTIFLGVRCLTDPHSRAFAEFSFWVLFIMLFSTMSILAMRYHRDFRWKRSQGYRDALRKGIEELKELRNRWDQDTAANKSG
jgi:hypothetical protein